MGDETRSRKPGRGGPSGGGQEQKVVLIWLESLEDADLVPLASLVPGINTVCLVIFLQPLASGLIRVKLAGHVGKMNLATPLVDGMVVSRRALGPLVRQTALNMCRLMMHVNVSLRNHTFKTKFPAGGKGLRQTPTSHLT